MGADKDLARTSLLELRAGLDPQAREALSEQILQQVRGLKRWASARCVLLYAPIRNEVDTQPLMDELFSRGVRVLLPRCRPDAPGEMDLACPNCPEELVRGAYGIPEPDPVACPPLPELNRETAPDVALVPGVGFDRLGYRLGYGQGYYDRLLASEAMAACLSLGLGYHFQLVDQLPRDPWDVPLRGVATDKEFVWTAS